MIRERVIPKMGLAENFRPFRDEELPAFESEMYDEIRRCNLHLALLLRTCEEIEDVFTLVTLFQVITSLCMMASNLFVLSLMDYTDPEFFPLIQYISAVLCQLSMICHFGSSVTEASINYRRCLYDCDWCSGSKRFKVCLLIMLCRLEKPLHLTAGKFFPLTLGTVISVRFNKREFAKHRLPYKLPS
nr:unnamed protein product [Callosobruchus analis]